MGLGRVKMGVITVVVVLMMRRENGEGILASSSEDCSPSSRLELCSSVGDGGPERVVDGGVGMDIVSLSFSRSPSRLFRARARSHCSLLAIRLRAGASKLIYLFVASRVLSDRFSLLPRVRSIRKMHHVKISPTADHPASG